jgi:hypothetical protein
MSDAPKNPDRHDDRRRQVGPEDEDPDGRAVADALYGGLDEHEPTPEEDGTTTSE